MSTSDTPAQQAVRRDFERVSEQLGRIPLRKEYAEHGDYDPLEFATAFANGTSYNAAVQNLGYAPKHPNAGRDPVSTDSVRRDFERVVETLGHVPTSKEYNEHGNYTAPTVSNKFADGSSYNDAVRALGYTPANSKRGITPAELRCDFERVVEHLGKVPSSPEYKTHGAYSPSTLVNKLTDDGRYRDAVLALGYAPDY